MKKITVIVTAAVLLFTTSAFAGNGDEVTIQVKSAFAKDFSKASSVKWERFNDFYFASFKMDDRSVDAAYTEDGELIGTARRISIDQLPLAVSRSLSRNYENYSNIGRAEEIEFEGEINYYLTVYNEKQVLKLKCASNGDITVESRKRRK